MTRRLVRRLRGRVDTRCGQTYNARVTVDDVENRLRRIEADVRRLRDSAISSTTWGVWVMLLAILAALAAVILALASPAVTIAPAVVAALASLLTILISLLLATREEALLRRVRALADEAQQLQLGERR